MKIVITCFVLLIIALPLTGRAATHSQFELMRAFCVAEWPDEAQLQMRCAERQAKSYRSVQFMMDRYPRGSKQRKFIQKCASRWKTSVGGYNWPKVFDCADLKLQRNP